MINYISITSFFLIRSISIDGWSENLMIATEDLQNCLFDENGYYINTQAKSIDERIFFFVGKDELTLSESQLSDMISTNLFAFK